MRKVLLKTLLLGAFAFPLSMDGLYAKALTDVNTETVYYYHYDYHYYHPGRHYYYHYYWHTR